MKELVVCSGKGGTGKTSVTAALADLASDTVLVDCDVDAADLHLVIMPSNTRTEEFRGGHQAVIDPEVCAACGECRSLCQFDAITGPEDGQDGYSVDPLHCEGCGVCVHFCPTEAISFPAVVNGHWFVSETNRGPLVHAHLKPGEENSGKLVTLVREKARKMATEMDAGLVLADGPPGIGCPTTAALTAADLLLAVTEPGVSGRHDLGRLLDLADHFEVSCAVCINKVDINPEFADLIESDCQKRNVPVVGRIPFDSNITQAQLENRSVMSRPGSPAAEEMEVVWSRIQALLYPFTRGEAR